MISWIEKEPLILRRRHSKIRRSRDERARLKWNQRASYRFFSRERARSMTAKSKLKKLQDVVADRAVPMEILRSLTPQIASILQWPFLTRMNSVLKTCSTHSSFCNLYIRSSSLSSHPDMCPITYQTASLSSSGWKSWSSSFSSNKQTGAVNEVGFLFLSSFGAHRLKLHGIFNDVC